MIQSQKEVGVERAVKGLAMEEFFAVKDSFYTSFLAYKTYMKGL